MCVCPCTVRPVINDPSQLVLGFKDTRFPESYEAGFDTGVNWDGNWMPGGPWVYTGSKRPDLREADETKHRLWHEGFNAGLKLRLKNNPHFAAWWHENKGLKVEGRYMRYISPGEMVQ